MEILLAISAFFKSIPALARIGELLDAWAKRWIAADVQKRKAEKDAAVDAGIDTVLHPPDLVHPPEAQQQPTFDGPTGLPGGSESGPGVGEGRSQDDQRPGIPNRE